MSFNAQLLVFVSCAAASAQNFRISDFTIDSRRKVISRPKAGTPQEALQMSFRTVLAHRTAKAYSVGVKLLLENLPPSLANQRETLVPASKRWIA